MFFRLWHQLTLQVLDFVQDPCFAQGDGLIKVNDLPCHVTVLKYAQVLFKNKRWTCQLYIYMSTQQSLYVRYHSECFTHLLLITTLVD